MSESKGGSVELKCPTCQHTVTYDPDDPIYLTPPFAVYEWSGSLSKLDANGRSIRTMLSSDG